MKKLISLLLTALIVIGVGTAVSASAGDAYVVYKANYDGYVTDSAGLGNYVDGETVDLSSWKNAGSSYKFTGWNVKDENGTAIVVNDDKFTIPSGYAEAGTTIYCIANYETNTEKVSASAEGSATAVENVNFRQAEGILNANVGDVEKYEVVSGVVYESDGATISEEAKTAIKTVGDSEGFTATGLYFDVTAVIKYTKDGVEGSYTPKSNETLATSPTVTVPTSIYNTDPSIKRTYYALHYGANGVEVITCTDMGNGKVRIDGINNYSPAEWRYSDTKVQNTNTNTNTSTGNVPCEASGRVWSESKQQCVYKVTNTSVH